MPTRRSVSVSYSSPFAIDTHLTYMYPRCPLPPSCRQREEARQGQRPTWAYPPYCILQPYHPRTGCPSWRPYFRRSCSRASPKVHYHRSCRRAQAIRRPSRQVWDLCSACLIYDLKNRAWLQNHRDEWCDIVVKSLHICPERQLPLDLELYDIEVRSCVYWPVLRAMKWNVYLGSLVSVLDINKTMLVVGSCKHSRHSITV